MSDNRTNDNKTINDFKEMEFAKLFESTPDSTESIAEMPRDVIKIKKELISHLAYLTVTNLKRDHDYE